MRLALEFTPSVVDTTGEPEMTPTYLDTILLIALPASGKSEVRRYLMNEKREERIEKFHLNDTVQLDDYPYVEFMRETDEALNELGMSPVFFENAEGRFLHAEDWGVLLKLVSQDYEVITHPEMDTPVASADEIFTRIDEARTAVGAPSVFEYMDEDKRALLAEKMHAKAEWVIKELFGKRPDSLEGKTVVIEFARGGEDGAKMPIPFGYEWSLSNLAPEILKKAAVLYIWVTPEESRRKNRARAIPGAENTVIFHGTPEIVMLKDYGCDDIEYLMEKSDVPGTIVIEKEGVKYHLPIARVDNRVDMTTFVRDEPETWPEDLRVKLHSALKSTLDELWKNYLATR